MKWLNAGAPLMALLILIGTCIVAHNAAVDHLEILGTPLPAMKPSATARLHFIAYIDAHPWFVLPYLAAWIAGLLWMQIRQSPHWCLFLSFALLALPLFGYVWICLRVATQI